MTEEEFRKLYPHSTEEQVQLYVAAVEAEKARGPINDAQCASLEPLGEPMPIITVPTTERLNQGRSVVPNCFFMANFSLDDVPPEAERADGADEMREILLGNYGFNLHLSEAQRERLQTEHMTEDEMLAMIVGAPSAREFLDLA